MTNFFAFFSVEEEITKPEIIADDEDVEAVEQPAPVLIETPAVSEILEAVVPEFTEDKKAVEDIIIAKDLEEEQEVEPQQEILELKTEDEEKNLIEKSEESIIAVAEIDEKIQEDVLLADSCTPVEQGIKIFHSGPEN